MNPSSTSMASGSNSAECAMPMIDPSMSRGTCLGSVRASSPMIMPRLDEGPHGVAHRENAARGLGADQHIVEIALASIQLCDTRFDLPQARGLVGQRTLGVGTPQLEHGAELIGGGILIDDPADLLQRETQVAKHQDAVQALQLRGRVVAVAAGGIHDAGLQQPELVVVPQQPRRDTGNARKLADPEHARVPCPSGLPQAALS